MARDLFAADEHFRELVRFGSSFLGEDLEDICLNGPLERLILSRYVQPLLVAVSLGYMHGLRKRGVEADIVLGHSLGEITALAAAGVVSETDAVAMAARRGQLMDQAASRCDGAMLAVLFVPVDKVGQLLDDLDDPDRIVLANDNAPKQIVLSGDRRVLLQFAAVIEEEKLGKCREVVVSGPWHSHYIESARTGFEEWAGSISFAPPRIDIIFNALAKIETDPARIKELITWQLVRPVFWRQSMNELMTRAVTTVVEVGPGKLLTGLARANGFRKSNLYNVGSLDAVEEVAASLT